MLLKPDRLLSRDRSLPTWKPQSRYSIALLLTTGTGRDHRIANNDDNKTRFFWCHEEDLADSAPTWEAVE